MPLRSKAIATHSPDMPAPTTATAGSRRVIGTPAILRLLGFGALFEALQRELDVLGIGGHPIGDAGGLAGDLAEPSWPAVPSAFGDLTSAVRRDDVVLPAGDRK